MKKYSLQSKKNHYKTFNQSFTELKCHLDFNLFFDAGKLFGNKTNPTSSTESIRSSYGFGIKWYTLIGPIGFHWGFPISSESYDIERMFIFSLGNVN